MHQIIIASILWSNCIFAKNYAIIMGGHAHWENNEFLPGMSQTAAYLKERNFEVNVLYPASSESKDWLQFPENTRPTKENEKDHQFSLKNFEKLIDKMIADGAGPGDQLHIDFNTHGGVINDRHISEWGKGFADNRNIFSPFLDNMRDLISTTRTNKIYDQIEVLLKKGIRINLNLMSCYSGQVLYELKKLQSKYPELLCATASSNSKEESSTGALLYDKKARADKSKHSALEHFLKYGKLGGQISSAIEAMTIMENFGGVAGDKDSKLIPLTKDNGAFANIEYICHYLGQHPTIAPEFYQDLTDIIDSVKKMPLKNDRELLFFACSKEGKEWQLKEAQEKISTALSKIKPNFIEFTYNDNPNFFRLKTIEGINYAFCGITEGVAIPYKNLSEVKCKKTFDKLYDEYHHISSDPKESAGQLKLTDLFYANLPLLKNYKIFEKEIDQILEDTKKVACDSSLLLKLQKKIITEQLKQADPKVIKGCQNFIY